MHGQRVCKVHGGMAGQNRRAAARRRAEAVAEKAVSTLGLQVDVSPTEALLEEVRWTAGHVQWLRARVQELGVESTDLDGSGTRHGLVWGTQKVVDKQSGESPGTDTTEASGPSVWYELYARERQHLVTVCTAALKAGVEERRVRLAESQGEAVAGAIRAILAELGLNREQQARVSEVVPRQLRLLAGGAV